ncbi:hypothetical protein F4604DRAFT_1973888 [Suillus subluteus]|nr:hypothetical protein F4604DRAFT_1973888 [Suillus subluteus]
MSHDAAAKAQEEHGSLLTSHAVVIANLKSEHQMSLAEVQASLVTAQEKHAYDLQESRSWMFRNKLSQSAVTELQKKHSAEHTTTREIYETLVQELEAHTAAASDFVAVRAQYELAVSEQTTAMASLGKSLAGAQLNKLDLQAQVTKLMVGLEKTWSERTTFIQEASKRESLIDELDRHRSLIAEMQESLQRVKNEKDNLQVEKNKQEAALRDMQIQIACTPIARETSTSRATPNSNISFTRINGIASKLPPPTPPPSMPPPPPPKTRESQFIVSVLAPSGPRVDSKAIAAKLEDQAKYIDGQEVMIKTLNKQLSHCESDLAAHMDLSAKRARELLEVNRRSFRAVERTVRQMKHDVEELKRVNAGLQDDVEELRQDNAGSKRDNTGMKHDVRKLGDQIDETNRAALGDKIAIGKIRRRTYGLTQSRKIPLSKYSTFQKNFVLVMRAVELTLEISVPSSSALLWVSASVSNNFTATSSATSSATIFSAETILTTMTLTNKGEVIRGQPRANPASSSPPSESENSHQFPPSPSGIHENQQLPPPDFAVEDTPSLPRRPLDADVDLRIASLRAMFPDCDDSLLSSVLQSVNGDQVLAIDTLFVDSYYISQPLPSPE